MFDTILLKIRNLYRNTRFKYFRNKYYDKLPKKINYFEGSVYDAIFESAIKFPNNTAIEYMNVQITYKKFIKLINKCSKSLKALGIKKNDKVSIIMPNTPEAIIMFYAINQIGAVSNMIHPLSSEKDIEYFLNKSKSKLVLCIDIAYKKVNNIIDNTNVKKIIVADAAISLEKTMKILYYIKTYRKLKIKEDNNVILWKHFMNLSNMYNGNINEKVDKSDPAVILYSGGTSGKSKGVMISNYSLNVSALQSRMVSNVLIPENAFLTFLPNFHAFGLGICTHTPLYNGMRIVLIPKFDSRKLKHYIRKYKFNVLCGVPTLYDYLIKLKFRKNELKTLKLVVCGGDQISLELKNKVNEFLKKYGSSADLRVGYGLTESSGVVALSPPNIENDNTVIGFPFPDVSFKIININTNEECDINEDGEILISGPNIMIKYLDEDEETNNTLIKDENNITWLKTGDIGYIDNKGLLHYKSRLKRMIITSGYNVYPQHIENILNELEFIKESVVVGIKNEKRGQIVRAYIKLKEGYNKSVKSDIIKHLEKHIAKYEMPKEIRFIDEIPTTLLGKVAYKELEQIK